MAAEVAFLPGEKAAQAISERRDRIERAGFLGKAILFGRAEWLTALFDAIERSDFAGGKRMNQDFVAFHCKACEKVYCEKCWRMGAMEFDEGFYDYTKAICPAGHEQTVDD